MGVPAAVASPEKKDKKLSKAEKADKEKKLSAKKRKKEKAEQAEEAEPGKKAKAVAAATEELSEEIPADDKSGSPDEFRKSHNIKVTGISPIPDPWMTFEQSTFAEPLKKALMGAGFAAPTPTQSQSWPMVCTGRDLISIAKTGSGKTVAFLLPCMEAMLSSAKKQPAKRHGRAPRLLVLAPTRELAIQIEEDAKKFGRSAGLGTVCLYGGSPKGYQIRGLEGGCDILVATPGRLNDIFEMGKVDLGSIERLVLDEADRMLDMGFEPQIKLIIGQVPSERQTLMFTATWPKQVQRLANNYLTNPATIAMGEQGVLHANKNITQHIYMMSSRDKEARLMKLIGEMGDSSKPFEYPKTIVFAAKKHVVQSLADKLWSSGMAVDSLHGDKEQWQRSKVIEAFKDPKARDPLRMVIATDVAARGLDVKDLQNVVNFDFPAGKEGIEDYVHRIGRTGRAGAKGNAFTFFDPSVDGRAAHELVTILTRAEQEVPDELQAVAKRNGPSSGGGGYRGRSNWRGGGRGGRGRGGGRGGRGRGGGFKKW